MLGKMVLNKPHIIIIRLVILNKAHKNKELDQTRAFATLTARGEFMVSTPQMVEIFTQTFIIVSPYYCVQNCAKPQKQLIC